MRISVIMPAFLQAYEINEIKSAKDPVIKFLRAVDSFIRQSFNDTELIIISDGCKITEQLYDIEFSHISRIKYAYIEKQSIFGGRVRQTGIEMAQGEIITYLDHDDYIGIDHLKIINDNFKDDWVYYNDYLIQGKEGEDLIFKEREVSPELYYIGTSMIAHRKDLNVVWGDGYAHDWRMIEKYLLPHPSMKIPTPEYYVCHFHPKDF